MPTISVQHLSKKFEHYKKAPGFLGTVKALFTREKIEVPAVQDISFDISEGEFVGFVGPNGAGKTTTLKMLSGILYPSGGEAEVLGFTPWKRQKTFQKQFALIMGQKNQLWWDLPPLDTFELHKAIYEIPEELYEQNLRELSELLDIESLLNTQVRKLSLGERMKCELTASLLHSPKILFLDEPTIGLDVVSQNNIREFLLNYNKKMKATIILTSHYMEDIRRLCDRVIIIDHGRILYDGNYQDLTRRYADTKTIDMVFRETVQREDLERFGKIAEYRQERARLLVPREQTTAVVTKLLQELPIDDISIHEETMEEIVREIFQQSRVTE